MSDFMWMETPLHALDVIADLIAYQSPLEEQDAWLQACIQLGFIQIDTGDDEQ